MKDLHLKLYNKKLPEVETPGLLNPYPMKTLHNIQHSGATNHKNLVCGKVIIKLYIINTKSIV